MINRDKYLDLLIAKKWNGMIKVVGESARMLIGASGADEREPLGLLASNRLRLNAC